MAAWPKVILFGDSITQFSFGEGGWGAFLADKLQRKCDVLNRGFTGYNSTLAKLALPSLLPKSISSQVSVLTLFLGANDAQLQGFTPKQHVSVPDFITNMKVGGSSLPGWGYNTTLGKVALHKVIPKDVIPEATMVTVFFGANDAVLEKCQNAKYVTVDDFCMNLKEIVQYLQDGGLQASQIILIAPPPIHNEGWKDHCAEEYGVEPNRSNSNTGLYAKACCTVAKDCGIDVLDLWTIMQQEPKWEDFLLDGLHLSLEGNKFVGKQLWKLVEPKIEDLQMQLPDWVDVDPNQPEVAFSKS